MVKRSQILRLRNMGPFQILNWHVKTVSNFAAAKYGTWWNGLKFCSCKIWDRFNFCPEMVKRSQNLRLLNMVRFRGPFQIYQDTCFDFWRDMVKRSHILQLQDIWLFQNLSRHCEMVSLLWNGNILSFQYKILKEMK